MTILSEIPVAVKDIHNLPHNPLNIEHNSIDLHN